MHLLKAKIINNDLNGGIYPVKISALFLCFGFSNNAVMALFERGISITCTYEF